MSRRPQKLHFAATHVVKASQVLTPTEKLVWLETWALDNGPEAAWISAVELGHRLAVPAGDVEECRRWFIEAGLHVIVRREHGREGYVCTLPHAACIPASTRPSRGMVFGCVAQLDSLLRDARDTPVRKQFRVKLKSDSVESEIRFAEPPAPAPSSSNLAVDSEKRFQPVVISEDGTVARNGEQVGEQQVGGRVANPDSRESVSDDNETDEQRWERLRATRRAQFREMA